MNDDKFLQFPSGFQWGVATSAYQVEGNSTNTQWSEFEKTGVIKDGLRSGVACEWWEKAERDFDLAQSLGLNALRLSVNWARIQPEEGVFNPAAIERYRQMLLGLIQRDIKPMVCLHHFVHPLWFENKGGFLSPTCIRDFTRFTRFVVSELGDLCDDWVTINEPNVYAEEGYLTGNHPPARKGHLREYFRVLDNMALCHGAAYHLIHDLQKSCRVGFANHFMIFTRARDQAFDGLAARIASDTFNNIFINLITGKRTVPFLQWDVRLDEVRDTWDYVGINIYGGTDVAFDLTQPQMGFVKIIPPASGHIGDVGPQGDIMFGEIFPQGIEIVVKKLARYGKPFYILENGVPDRTDRLRPWVIATAVKTMHDLIRQGYDIRGYHHWTLVDNFEWTHGYSQRFGLVELDLDTQERRPRPSAYFYSEIVRANGMDEAMVRKYVPSALDEIFPAT